MIQGSLFQYALKPPPPRLNNREPKTEKKRKAPTPVKETKSKRRPTVAQRTRHRIWETFMGHQSQHPCLLCGVTTIHKTKKYGFEAAHIVAFRYSRNVSDPYLIIPSCSTCNNEMGDANLFDWLVDRARHQALREIAWTIFECFQSEFPTEHHHSIVHVFRKLYGIGRFSNGGGITNRKVYEMLQQLQLSKIHERQRVLAQEQEKLAIRSRTIIDESIIL